MTTRKTPNGNNGKQPQGDAKGFPFPKAFWAANNRDPDAIMALFWAVDRLLSRKRKPSLCYPGACDCPYCHPDHLELTPKS